MTTSSTAERLARLALTVLLATVLTACGGGDGADDDAAFVPALAPSQPEISIFTKVPPNIGGKLR
jgi:hypothetical protein